MNIKDLIKDIKVKRIENERNCDIKDIAFDSRKVGPCSLFVAVKGEKADGHLFIGEAVKRGASGVVVEDISQQEIRTLSERDIPIIFVKDSREALALIGSRFYDYPSQKLLLIGITGTNGKTTITYITKNIFQKDGRRTGIIGTLGYQIGDELIPLSNTTPESIELNSIFNMMLRDGISTVIMEVSSHALKLSRVKGLEFDAAVFTNLTQDHLDFHKTWDDYLESKLRLFSEMKRGKNKKAIINSDDPSGRRFIEETGAEIWRYGMGSDADIYPEDIEISMDGIAFNAVTPAGKFHVRSKLIGRHNLYNILASIGVGFSQGIDCESIREGIWETDYIPGRCERIIEGQDFTVVVDYAHTEDALSHLLMAVSEVEKGAGEIRQGSGIRDQGSEVGRIITVFGCGGDRDRGKRPLMGKVAGAFSDIVIITSDNPRTEDPGEIIREIEAGIRGNSDNDWRMKEYFIVPDRRDAIEKGISIARRGDIVVIAGKGHEDYQIIEDKRLKFDDREAAREAIRKREGDDYLSFSFSP
ncbi:MAG: UDP-N-acetylmuramoyl-L-alanyl-D-glutamate--2,6-diaminopimelate ligase [Nitrospirota bacterium]